MLDRIDLRVVPTSSVRPHEVADPGREHRIEQRLRDERVLRDPVMVGSVPGFGDYILLDGTNRLQALKSLGANWILAQVIDYADEHAVQLQTWSHAATVEMDEILRGVRRIPDASLTPLPPLATADTLRSPQTLAVLLDHDQQHAIVRDPGHEISRAEQLRRLVDLYEEQMTRVEGTADDIEERAQRVLPGDEPAVLVAFPPFTRSQVVTMAVRGTPIPAGITRHVIFRGRALRVNIPLEILMSSPDELSANSALRAHLKAQHPRLYQEPTILFDS